MSGLRRLVALLALAIAAPAAAGPAAPTADVHDIAWFVHVDLIDAAAGRDLGFYRNLIDETILAASDLYEGNHGPVDTPCCTRIERSIPVASFGSPGDGLDVLDSAAEYTSLAGIGLPGSRAFLVDSLTYCGGPAPAAIGCALQPACDGNADDDPDLWMVVTLDAQSFHSFARTTAHERGHNACLLHLDTTECQLMRSSAGGHCVDAGQCSNLQAGRTTSGGSCACHDGVGGIEADGSSCSEVAGGLCSGGLCGDPAGDAGIQLLASGGPGSAGTEPGDDPLRLSALPGGWIDLGDFGASSQVPSGLAHAHDEGVVYGILPSSGDDTLVRIDPATGSITGTVGAIANGSDEFTALAYDPGPTPATGDDRLLGLESDGTFDELYEIDPTDASTRFIGALAFGGADGFLGLAYDSLRGALYTSSPFPDGLYEIDLSSCPFFCGVVQQLGVDVARFDSSLTFSRETGMLYLVGTQVPGPTLGNRTLYDVIDPLTLERPEQRLLASYTPAGLSAVALPEPRAWMLQGAGLALLVLLGRRRARAHR